MLTDDQLDADRCYRAVSSRDDRFDGWFFTGVHTTGIYCRPSCVARTPKRCNVSFFRTAAAAQAAGLRACRRCRPDAVPGSPEWNVRADAVGRVMRAIGDGVVERVGISGLAAALGYSGRHLHRMVVGELGVGPLALARAQRAHTARILIETTELPIGDVAFAAGFTSIRQFNDTIHEVFARTPSELRRGTTTYPAAATGLTLRLAHRAPYDRPALLNFLTGHAVPGIEEVVGGTYRRVLDLPHGPAVVELTPDERHSVAVLRLADLRDLATAVARCRRILDADHDPLAVRDALGDDPLIGPLIRERPGLRVPGSPDGFESAVRTVIGQQISVRGGITLTGRVVQVCGTRLPEPDGGLTHIFPRPEVMAETDLTGLGMTGARIRTLGSLASAVVDGTVCLDISADRGATMQALQSLPGIGGWTASYVAMRGLSDPDVFLGGDLVARRALDALDLDHPDPAPVRGPTRIRAAEADQLARAWAPWRSYALMHLWTHHTGQPRQRR